MLPLLSGLLLAVNTYAAHIIGGVITYKCLGYTNNDPNTHSRTYQFSMKIYRDCQGNGAGFDSDPMGAFDASVTIFQEGSNTPLTTYLLDPPEVTDVDPNPGNSCVIVPPFVCVEQGEYIFPIINLPIIEGSYFITYQRCCRNNTISNIFNPAASGATYTMELTAAAQAACNSSPVFDNFPPAVLCVGEAFTFNHVATDPDGDQLVYELCTPFLGGGTQGNFGPTGVAPNPDLPPPYAGVNFIAPNYTALHPLGVNSGIAINPVTGILTGTPLTVGQFVVGICVSEYRNGVLLSTVRRDFQFNITTCQVLVSAELEAEQQNGVYQYESCGDLSLFFENESFQQSNIHNFHWEFDIPGPPVTVNTWDASVDFPEPGNYTGRLLLNTNDICPDTARLNIQIYPGITADFVSDYDTCRAGLVDFNDLSVTGGQITSSAWDFGDGNNSTSRSPQHSYRLPGEYQVSLEVENANGCSDRLQTLLRYFPVPQLILVTPNRKEDCPPAEIRFNNLSAPLDETYEITWDFGDGRSSNEVSPAHVFEEVGLFDVSMAITSPIGCHTDTTFREMINILPGPIADFSFTPEKPDPFNPLITFTDHSTDAWRWNWNFDGVHTSIEQHPTYLLPDTGIYRVVLRVTHPNGCQDTLARLIDVAPVVTFHMPNAFTPNNDSVNDVFKGEGFLRGVEDFSLKIWSRWGDLIFESSSPDFGWNGLIGSQQAPQGVYLYEVSVGHPRGIPEFYKGFVTLVR